VSQATPLAASVWRHRRGTVDAFNQTRGAQMSDPTSKQIQNRLIVLTRWAFAYLTRGRGARVIHDRP